MTPDNLLKWIRLFQKTRRYSPSLTEIAFKFNVSKQAAFLWVKDLVSVGDLEQNKKGIILFPKDFKF